MRKSQWNVLGWGFLVISLILNLYKTFFVAPTFKLSQEISTTGTSNLEVITSLTFFSLTIISSIFLVLAILFWVNAWLEKKAHK